MVTLNILGGAIELTSGSSQSGGSGIVSIQSSNSSGYGNSGAILLGSGSAQYSDSGAIIVRSGFSAAATAGNVSIEVGTSSVGAGSALFLRGGDTNSLAAQGGVVMVRAGDGTFTLKFPPRFVRAPFCF